MLRTPPDQKIGTFSTASATLLSGLSGAGNLAVDASGNIFFTDVNNPYVTELLAINGVVTPSSPQIAVGSGLSSPRGLTVDGNGNVFVADRGNNRIVEIVAVNGAVSANSTVQALGSGFSQPWDVSLDAAGDLLISDYGNSALKELIAGNGVVAPNSIPVTLLDNTTNPILQPYFPLAVNIDASSNVRLALTAEALTGIPNGSFDFAPGGVILLPYSTAPELAFSGTTAPQSLTVFNSGNEPLSFSDVSVDTSNFSLSGSTCTSATTLAPSTACTLVMAPNPAVTGIVTGTVHLSDNGQPGSTQTVALIYYGPAPPAAMLFTPASPVLKGFVALLTASCNVDSLDPIAFSILSGPATLVTSNGTYIRYTGFGPVVIQATQAAGSGSPTCPTMTATVQVVAQQTIGFPMPSQTIFPGFATLAATATSGLPVSYTVLSGPATIAGSTLTYTGAGPVVVQATQAGNANNVAAVPVTVTIQVSLAEAFIDWAPTALKIYTGTPLGAGVLDATDSIPATIGYTAALVPAGSPAAVDPTTVLPQGSYTLTALFTPFDLTHYGPVSDSLGFDVQNMNVFTANGAAGVGSFYNIGTVQSSAVSAGGIGMAVDNAGYVWSANEDGSGVSRFTNDGIRAGNYTGAAGVSRPSAVAIDGAGTVWVANGGNGTVSAYSNAGTALTPPGGSSTGSAGASGIAIDQSGNVWVSSAGGNSVTELLGAATPAVPIATGVANLTLGSRP